MSETNPVSAEARGKAREFIRRAHAEDDLRFALLSDFHRDIQRRIDRRPGRRLRPDMLDDILRRWEAGPREFRLRFEVEWKGKNLWAIEITASGSSTFTTPDWPADATELNLMVNTAALKSDRQGADFVNVGSICSSFHAIGRYFQRQPDRGDAELLSDLAVFARLAVSPDAPKQEVRYPTKGGTWVGRVTHCDVEAAGQTERRAMLLIRTWIPR